MTEKRKRAFDKNHLKTARNMRGINQEDLADRIGIDQSQYARYENGTSEPTPYFISRLAVELNVTTDYLLGLTDDPSSYIPDADLSETERKLLSAFRQGNFRDLMKIASEETEAQH